MFVEKNIMNKGLISRKYFLRKTYKFKSFEHHSSSINENDQSHDCYEHRMFKSFCRKKKQSCDDTFHYEDLVVKPQRKSRYRKS